jgi:LCP family protein required for cell wall assembly
VGVSPYAEYEGNVMKSKKAMICVFACCVVLFLVALAGCQKALTAEDVRAVPEPVDKEDVKNSTSYSKRPFYALLVGNDSRDGTVDEGKGKHGSDGRKRSDVMMRLRVDPKKHQVTIVSIPRDTQAYDGDEKIKINWMYNRGGIEASVDKVEEYTGANIKYYFDVSFAEFVKLVDALGGVDVNVPADMTFRDVMSGDKITLQAGDQHLEGNQALVFARVRKIFQEMDSSRQYDDRQIIQSLMQKAIDNPEKLAEYTGDFMDIVHTNMDADALAYYLKDFIDHKDDVKFLSGSFPAEGDIDAETGQWLAWRDPDQWAAIMEVVDKGGDPNDVYTPPFG